MRSPSRSALVGTALCLILSSPALAQDDARGYAGALVGVATLSADARTSIQAGRAEVSLYKPENGPALNLLAGGHLGRYFTIQANYIWNRNDLTLFSLFTSSGGGAFDEHPRRSSQHALVGDAIVYFRAVGSGVRPYLSAGAGVMRFQSRSARVVSGGVSVPVAAPGATRVALRVAVGMDLAMDTAWSFRYSFSETISGNPISARLTPPGERNLANFQNLFGIIRHF